MVTEDECIEALEEAAERLGHSPTKPEYEELDITPSASTILRHCGSWNEAKEQAGLETNPSSGSRVQEKPDDVELPEGVEWAELTQDQRWHYANREKNNQRTLDRRQKLRSWVYEQKEQRGCAQCGLEDGSCLDFHHREDANKRLKISKMVTFGHGVAELRREIEKCEVLCVNCHRLQHFDTPSPETWTDCTDPAALLTDDVGAPELPNRNQRQRAWIHEYKTIRGCRRCGVRHGGCLDLHHVDEDDKRESVSQLIIGGGTDTELRTELQKCEVLCANCHRREHYETPDYVGDIEVVDGVVRVE